VGIPETDSGNGESPMVAIWNNVHSQVAKKLQGRMRDVYGMCRTGKGGSWMRWGYLPL
jgi:hypothetical protein